MHPSSIHPQRLYVGFILSIFQAHHILLDIILEIVQEEPPALLRPLLGIPVIRGSRVAIDHVQERSIVSKHHKNGIAGIEFHHLPYAFDRLVMVVGAIRSVERLRSRLSAIDRSQQLTRARWPDGR